MSSSPILAPSRLSSEEVTHLEMIQGVITRMASNSFNIKAWEVGVVTGAIALTTKDRVIGVLLAIAIALSFWFLDSYYLRQERLYRRLFNDVRRQHGVNAFDMSAEAYQNVEQGALRTMFTKTQLAFHGPLVVTVGTVGIYFRYFAK
jgi:hypothetical protein